MLIIFAVVAGLVMAGGVVLTAYEEKHLRKTLDESSCTFIFTWRWFFLTWARNALYSFYGLAIIAMIGGLLLWLLGSLLFPKHQSRYRLPVAHVSYLVSWPYGKTREMVQEPFPPFLVRLFHPLLQTGLSRRTGYPALDLPRTCGQSWRRIDCQA
jgi:hypothetical protein